MISFKILPRCSPVMGVFFLFCCGVGEIVLASNLVASDDISHRALFDERVRYALGADISPLAKKLGTRKKGCEALTHFIQTGVPDHYSSEWHNLWRKRAYGVNPFAVTHRPYTGYVLFIKNKAYLREDRGDWGFVHAFIVTGDGRYLSCNGLGPIRIFRSYQDMLLMDGFPHGFVDGHGYPLKSERDRRVSLDEKDWDAKEMIPPHAVMGESVIFNLQDMTGSNPPPLSESQTEIYIYKNSMEE